MIRDNNGNLIQGSYDAGDFGNGQLVAYTTTAAIANPVWTNKAVLTSDATAPADGDTVTIGAVTYTFKTNLTPAAGEVHINGSAAAALLNLIRAINHTGTAGTDYANSGVTAVANPSVIADAAVTASTYFQVYDLVTHPSGTVTLATASGGTNHLSWSSTATMGGKTGDVRVLIMCSTAAYIAFAAAPTATTSGVPMSAGVAQMFTMPAGYKVAAVQAASGGNLTVLEVV